MIAIESLDQFLDRVYFNGPKAIVLVFKSKKVMMDITAKDKPEKWTLETAKQYINWLQNNEKEIVV